MKQATEVTKIHRVKLKKDSKTIVQDHAANELIFAVVGHVGSGTSTIANKLANLLKNSLPVPYEVDIIKATNDVISQWALANDKDVPKRDSGVKKLSEVEKFQNLGDAMRLETKDNSAIAKGFVVKIRELRAVKLNKSLENAQPILPDGKFRAYILDSIRHPAEVELLRHIYQDAFFLIGVVCEETKRLERVTEKYADAGKSQALELMKRDSKAKQKHGQRVSDAFHLSDFFVDNTEDRADDKGISNHNWDVVERLSRLLKIIRHPEIVRPEVGETAMLHAYGAAMRSACLSRQVGAALVDNSGNVIATGSNEVPKAGGGLYGETFAREKMQDHRCAYRRLEGDKVPFCSSTRERNDIINELLEDVSKLKILENQEKKEKLEAALRESRIGDILEFSRAVHAEMDAIIAAGRKGISTVGSRLFVTTFPCHYCARHIVVAGINEVQYIEPYPKSRALKLHSDSIVETTSDWLPPSILRDKERIEGGNEEVEARVLFRPFTGVAPRLYRRAFRKDRDLKNDMTGNFELSDPDWVSPWHLRRMSYAQLEAELASEGWHKASE